MAKRRGKKKAGSGRPRKKKKVESPPVDLPDHLMEVIFQRLPPKSLAVSRCVSPSWNNLISSPAFARRYDEAKAAEATSGPVRDPVFADGRLHWMPSKRALNETYGDSDGILAFVLSGEFFRSIPMPAFTNGSKRPIRATLTELNSRLCLVRDLRSQTVALFDIWMLHDESWTLDRRLDLTPHLCKEPMQPWIAFGGVFVLRYVSESPGQSRKILLATTVKRVYVYEPDTKELRTVAKGRGKGHMRLVLYQESLAQVAGMEYGKQEIEFKFSTDG